MRRISHFLVVLLVAIESQAQPRWLRGQPQVAGPDSFLMARSTTVASCTAATAWVSSEAGQPTIRMRMSISPFVFGAHENPREPYVSGKPNQLIGRLTDDELFQCCAHLRSLISDRAFREVVRPVPVVFCPTRAQGLHNRVKHGRPQRLRRKVRVALRRLAILTLPITRSEL
jgi:hypothetical protein